MVWLNFCTDSSCIHRCIQCVQSLNLLHTRLNWAIYRKRWILAATKSHIAAEEKEFRWIENKGLPLGECSNLMGMNGKYAVRIPNRINKKDPEFFFRYISPRAKVIDIKRYFLSFSVSEIERESEERAREYVNFRVEICARTRIRSVHLPTDRPDWYRIQCVY